MYINTFPESALIVYVKHKHTENKKAYVKVVLNITTGQLTVIT